MDSINVTIFRLNAKTGNNEAVDINIEGNTAHCNRPCLFNGFGLRVDVADSTTICLGVKKSGRTSNIGSLPADTDHFPECGFPTRESVAAYQAALRGSTPEQEG